MTTRFLASTVRLAVTLSVLMAASAATTAPRVLPEGKQPNDVRLEPLKDLDGYFPFTPPASKTDWGQRAERVRRQILVSQGLWPMPAKTPLHPVIYGRMDRGDYTVEKVYFESVPGFFVTGNLYRPKNAAGKVPGVLFAHGHWTDARLSESDGAELRREIADGEERFEEGGRSRFQSMCVQLARMGCVVWQWDMLGNSDAQQFSLQLAHQFAKQRPEMNTTENWGLFSPQAEAHLQSVMGLQTWNSIRSLDFLLSLPEVDPERIAMTGASGGGTQTMLLAGIDPRVKLSFPAVMVSTAMQGGCTCENACLLRVDTGNVEFAGLFAPQPQGLTTANDWTKEMATKGFPELKQLYTLLGAPDHVMLKRGEHFPHNYNAVSRSAFYTWLNRHFNLGQKEPVIERDYQRLKREELSVWNEQHPAPKTADPDFERQLLRGLHDQAQQQLAAEQATPGRFRNTYGAAFEIVLGARLAEAGDLEWKTIHQSDRGAWTETAGLLRNQRYHEELPAVLFAPKQGNGHTVVWLSGEGKSALYTADGTLQPAAEKLLKSGATLAGVDLLYQGEFLADGQPLTRTPRVKNPREAAPYTFGYNSALFVHRVHDVLSVVRFIKNQAHPPQRLTVVGFDGAGPWVAAARAQAGEAIDQAVIDTGGFRFSKLLALDDPNFLPGGAKYGDLPALLALGAPGRTWVAGETEAGLALAQSQYQSLQAGKHLTQFTGDREQARSAALEWLLAKADTNGSFSYVPYRFSPDERWHTGGAGNLGATRLSGKTWGFDFSQGAAWVSLGLPDRSLLGRPEKIRLRASGSAPGHPVRLIVHTHFMTFHKIVGEFAGEGEQELVVDAPPGPGWEWHSGENDGKLHGPLRLGEIRLEAGGKKDAGTLALLSVTIDGTCPPDQRCVLTVNTATNGVNVVFSAVMRALSDTPIEGILRWTIRNWDGNELGQGNQPVTLPPHGEPLNFALPAPPFSAELKFAEVEFSLAIPGQKVLTAQAYWLAKTIPYEDASLRPESPFGMGLYLCRYQGAQMEQAARLARDAGVKWSREDFSWGRLEPERGQFHWDYYDRLLDCARRNGITVYAIVGYWTGWTKPYTSAGIDDYVVFLRQLVKRYQNQIKQWEIWNEPNIFFWQGPKELYAELLTKSYQAIKEIDPNAEVLGLSTAGIDFKFIEQMLAKQAPFDVLTIHPYRKKLEDASFIADLKKVSDLVRLPDGRRRPVWLTEMGWATHTPHNALAQDFQSNTQRAQAELIARTYLCSIVSGVEPRTFWYDFRNDGEDPIYFEHNMGIVTRDFAPKPAYQTYATLARVLEGKKLAGPVPANEGTFAYRFLPEKNGAGEVFAVWNPGKDANVTLTVPDQRITLINAVGERRELPTKQASESSGARTVQLELQKGKPVYLMAPE